MSGRGRCVRRALEACSSNDFEGAATSIFQAIDSTGKRRMPGSANGARFKRIVSDQEDIITATAVGSVIKGAVVENLTLPQVLWKFGRNPLLHDAELDPRLSFSNYEGLSYGSVWNLPPSFLVGLAVGVISARENIDEEEVLPGEIFFWGEKLSLQSLWGQEDLLRKLLPP